MKYLSLLRGINVSGQKKIKMADLKVLYESLGLKNVSTYIQSGNVMFDSDLSETDKVISLIETEIEKQYQFFVPVVLRTKEEIEKIITNCPFSEAKDEAYATKVLVTILNDVPEQEKIEELKSSVKPPEKLVVCDKEVYIFCPNGYGKSKLTNNFIEKKLERSATTRNWKSINKLNLMME